MIFKFIRRHLTETIKLGKYFTGVWLTETIKLGKYFTGVWLTETIKLGKYCTGVWLCLLLLLYCTIIQLSTIVFTLTSQ